MQKPGVTFEFNADHLREMVSDYLEQTGFDTSTLLDAAKMTIDAPDDDCLLVEFSFNEE